MEVLSNKQYREDNRVSRYSVFPYYYNREDNKYVNGITAPLKKQNVNFVSHKVERNDTLDSLSLYYYGNSIYFWAIADFNDITDCYADLKVGNIIKIPTFNAIEFDIE